jgi:hypothetical protein
MTQKQKANEIANLFVTKSIFDMDNNELQIERENAKKFSIIAVNETIKVFEMMIQEGNRNLSDSNNIYWDKIVYLNAVIVEIDKL